MSVTSEYKKLLDEVDRAVMMLERINTRVHALIDAYDDERVKELNTKLEREGKVP